jgi:hypothetical protein
MSTGGNFDQQSASRISRAVRYVEGGWPVPTKQTRRPPLADAGGTIQIVRLIENVPGARLVSSTDDFYDRFRAAIGDRIVNEMDQSELLRIGSEIINTYSDDAETTSANSFVERFFGSGLAWLCEFEDGRNREALEQGQVTNVLVRYIQVVRVWNMHSRAYNTTDVGGVFGNEAGGLGGGYCNAIVGWDGELWLVQPDRRLEYQLTTGINDALDGVSAVAADMAKVKLYLDDLNPDWDSIVG